MTFLLFPTVESMQRVSVTMVWCKDDRQQSVDQEESS